MSMTDEDFQSFLWALENTSLSWAADDLRDRDTAQREALTRVEEERDQWQTAYWKQYRITGEAQAQLAEAVGLLKNLMESEEGSWAENCQECAVASTPEWKKLEAFLGRHDQDQQKES